jgi:SAM-dependent methyltransferase
MGTFLQVVGSLLVLASSAWLAASLIAPGSVVILEVTGLFLPTALIGLTLVWLGRKQTGRRAGSDNPRTIHDLLDGYRSTALLYLGAKLGIADLLADGPRSNAELAGLIGAHVPSLHRVLRGLVAVGACTEGRDGLFGLTRLGESLQSGKPDSLRGFAILCGEEFVSAWLGLAHSVMSGDAAFNHVFGMSQWEHRERHQELNYYFNDWLRSVTNGVARDLLAAYDFSSFRTIADVGGGQGALLSAILNAYPAATGILFDQAHVIEGALPIMEAAGVASRCRIVGGSFFDSVPGGIDACVLKSVIHDWDDERSLAILKNCRKALKKNGKLLLIERILPVRVEHHPHVILIDLHMLALTGGRERTEGEYRTLFATAGFKLEKVIRTQSGYSIIEGQVGR